MPVPSSATAWVVVAGAVEHWAAALGLGLFVTVVGYVFLSRHILHGRARDSESGSGEVGASTAPAVEAWPEEEALQVLVANRSNRPVHDVRAFVAMGRRRASCVGWIRTLPPTGDDAAQVALTADSRESWIAWQDRHGVQEVEVECTFRDDTGQYWRRGRKGDLIQIPVQR